MNIFEDTNPRALKDLRSEIQSPPGFPLETVLASHDLPAGADSPLLRDDYEAFLAWRLERCVRRSGASQAQRWPEISKQMTRR
jgi:hypothetical protein